MQPCGSHTRKRHARMYDCRSSRIFLSPDSSSLRVSADSLTRCHRSVIPSQSGVITQGPVIIPQTNTGTLHTFLSRHFASLVAHTCWEALSSFSPPKRRPLPKLMKWKSLGNMWPLNIYLDIVTLSVDEIQEVWPYFTKINVYFSIIANKKANLQASSEENALELTWEAACLRSHRCCFSFFSKSIYM